MEKTIVRIDKEWGYEQIVCNTDLYCAKFLHFHPGKKSSLHYHLKKDETFHVMDGECRIQTSMEIGNHKELPILRKGDLKHIPPALPHRVFSERGCVILEVSTHHSDADVVRLEPSGSI